MVEEKAIPEPFRVKGEMLDDDYEGSFNLSKYLVNKYLKVNNEEYKTAIIYILDLFLILRKKIKFPQKEYKCLVKLDKWVKNPNGNIFDYPEWNEFFEALQFKLEELNITKIEMEAEDVYTTLKRP